MVILFPVEKRKYLPSEVRLIKAGSWTLQSPEQAPGVCAATEEMSEDTLNRAVAKNVENSIMVINNRFFFEEMLCGLENQNVVGGEA